MQRIGALLVGIVLGASGTLAVKGHDLELLYLQMNKLRGENNQLQEEIDSLKKDLINKQRQSIRRVRKIEVTVKAPDEFTKLAIGKYVKDHTRSLIDQELAYLESHPLMVKGLVDGRVVSLDNQSYSLRVELVVIGETLSIWVEGTKQPVSS